jgi:hypothetical protein
MVAKKFDTEENGKAKSKTNKPIKGMFLGSIVTTASFNIF